MSCAILGKGTIPQVLDKVKQIFPGWKEPKKWLKENNYLLRLLNGGRDHFV